jgi:multidrug efflux pump subunit AcrA (membrane-fusion protein)
LVKDNLVSIQELDLRRTELDAVAAELKASKANRDIAELNRSRCLIAAPFDALVLDRTVSVGQLVTPGTAVVKLLDLESIEIRAEIFSADAEFLDNESSLEFSDGTQRYPVRLGTLVAAINGVNRNREARLQFIGEAPLPGTSGKLHWLDPRPHLPPGYLVQRDQQLGYFVARDGKAEFVFLESAQPGRSNPVIADLDEQIVIEGFAGLQTGDSISVEPE